MPRKTELSIGKFTAYIYLMDFLDLDPHSNASYGDFLNDKQKLNERFTYNYRFADLRPLVTHRFQLDDIETA